MSAKKGGADKDTAIAQQIQVAPLTVNRVRQRFAERGLHKSLPFCLTSRRR